MGALTRLRAGRYQTLDGRYQVVHRRVNLGPVRPAGVRGWYDAWEVCAVQSDGTAAASSYPDPFPRLRDARTWLQEGEALGLELQWGTEPEVSEAS
jgi:hypothetical protein